MSARPLMLAAGIAMAVVAAPGCRSRPASKPDDLLLNAIRADEQEGNLTHVESQGKHLFLHYCATCHGDEGRGDGQNASNLTPPPPDLTAPASARTAALLKKVIIEGSASVGRSPLSPPWGRSLSGQEIDYLVAYCQSLSRRKAG